MNDLFDWTPPPGYPNRPGWKEPTTSRDAAEKVAPAAKTLRDQVLAAFRNAWPAGHTADEIAALLGKSVLSVRPRLSELRKAKEIVPAMAGPFPSAKPMHRKNESGLDAIVWVCRRPEGET